MKNLIFITCLFSNLFLYSQVGIGTSNPNANLDIRSSNETTPANTDGILIPQADAFPVTNPMAAQDGMLLYITGDGAQTKGFYYWDDSIPNWVPIGSSGGVEKIDDLLDGKSDNDGTQDGSSVFLGIGSGTNDDATDNRNASVGYNSMLANTTGRNNIANGYNALRNNTTGQSNNALGSYALFSNTSGINNTANGFDALYTNTTGNENTASGAYSLFSNTSGVSNTADGYNALRNNTTGNNNTAQGNNSLFSNVTGSNNIAIGINASYLNTTGWNNISIGQSALYNNTISWYNIAIGTEALQNYVGINPNIAIGYQTLQNATTGSSNTALGYQAGRSTTTGTDNSFFGSFAGTNNLSGAQNTFFGLSSGVRNTTGNNNIAIGHQALRFNQTGSSNVIIGYLAGEGSLANSYSGNVFIGNEAGRGEINSNRLYIDNSNSTIPLIYGEFDTNILRANAELQVNNPATTGYAFPTADGSSGQVLTTDGGGQVSFQSISAGSSDVDFYRAGTTTAPTNINDNIFTLGRLGIGGNPSSTLHVNGGVNPFRIDISGVEKLSYNENRLEFLNTGNSIFIGEDAGLNDDSSNNRNTVVGRYAGRLNTTGEINAFFGLETGLRNDTGSFNSYFGASSGRNNTTGSFNAFFGYSAGGSNEGSDNTGVGSFALTNNSTGANNTAIGHNALNDNDTGIGNVAIGFEAAMNATNLNNKLYIENSSGTRPLVYGDFSNDQLGINWDYTMALPNTLSVNGDASKAVAGSWLANSDARLKKEINYMDSESILNKVLEMKGATYLWNDDKTGIDRPFVLQYGFIAQDLQKVWPEKVVKDSLGYLQTAYGDYDPMFVEAFKALNTKIELLEDQNTKQIIHIEKLTEEIKELKKLEEEIEIIKKTIKQ